MKNSQKYMQNRIRFLTIISWVVIAITVLLCAAVLADAFTKSIGVVGAVASAVQVSGGMAPVLVGVVLVVILALVGIAIFSGLLDQAALLQTALNIETNGDQMVEEVRIMNKYLRQIVPFLKEPPGRS